MELICDMCVSGRTESEVRFASRAHIRPLHSFITYLPIANINEAPDQTKSPGIFAGAKPPVRRKAYGSPATSFTSSLCRVVPVLPNKLCKCVFTVACDRPSVLAMALTPLVLSMASSTRTSPAVRL